MSRILLALLVACFSLPLAAQTTLPGNSNIYGANGVGIVYDNELSFNVAIASPKNIIFGVRSGKITDYNKARTWSATLGTIRHSRERRENPDRLNPANNRVSRAYVFGKQNNLYALRVGFGQRRYLTEKARVKGVAVGWSYEVGPSLGLLKPYYLEVARAEVGSNITLVDEKYSAENADRFLSQSDVFGGSAWTVGLDELKIRPGAHVRAAAHFGFGAYDETIKAIEAGFQADFFLGDTDIMVESPQTPGISNSPLFLSLFVNLQIGKRW